MGIRRILKNLRSRVPPWPSPAYVSGLVRTYFHMFVLTSNIVALQITLPIFSLFSPSIINKDSFPFQAMKQLPREQVQLASKFGLFIPDWNQIEVKGTPDYVRQCCEASLKRLDVDYVDLYYQHRVDVSVLIEDTVSTKQNLFTGLCSQFCSYFIIDLVCFRLM